MLQLQGPWRNARAEAKGENFGWGLLIQDPGQNANTGLESDLN